MPSLRLISAVPGCGVVAAAAMLALSACPAAPASASARGRLYTVTFWYRYEHAWDFDNTSALGGACVGEAHYVGSGRWVETSEKTMTIRLRRGRLRNPLIRNVPFKISVRGSMTLIAKIEGPATDPDCTPRTETEQIPSQCGSDEDDTGTIEIFKRRSERGRLQYALFGEAQGAVIPQPCFAPVGRNRSRNLKQLGYKAIPLRKLAKHSQPYYAAYRSDWDENVGEGTGGWPYPTHFTQQWHIRFQPKGKKRTS